MLLQYLNTKDITYKCKTFLVSLGFDFFFNLMAVL